MRFCLLLALLCIPSFSLASVQITEVAWMGSIDSPNHEWIELYNSGETTSLSGWILHDASNLTIELAGTIEAGAYIVLERTTDESAPGEAFLTYTGALNNSGATLVLRDGLGEVVDQVSGGDNWEIIGGNNSTKETAQRIDSGWKTAVATPGVAANPAVIAPVVSPVVTTSQNNSRSLITQAQSGIQQTLTLPDISLQLDLSAPTTVFAGQPINFEVEPSGVGNTIANSLQYTWSMGNGETVQGKEVEYTFEHPGQYVVVVEAGYKRQVQYTRHTITVLPVSLSIRLAPDGLTYIVQNNSINEIDIGGFRFVGPREYTFPNNTIILPNTPVRIPSAIMRGRDSIVALYDQTNLAVAVYIPGSETQTDFGVIDYESSVQGVSAEATMSSLNPVHTTESHSNFGFASEVAVSPVASTTTFLSSPPAPQNVALTATPNNQLHEHWPTYVLTLLLFFGAAGIYLVPQKKDDPPWV